MAKNTAPSHRKPSVQKWADRPKTIRALRAHGEMVRKESETKVEMAEVAKKIILIKMFI